MTPDPWDRGKCTPLVSKLSRGDAPDTGDDAVEGAWTELDHAAAKAATAFATHVGASTTRIDDPLPAALDALDAARDKLRAAAGLPPDARTGSPLPVAQILPITDGNDTVESLDLDTLPSAHGMVLFGKTANRMVQVNLIAGGKPQVGRVGPGSMRAIPDPTWGARPGEQQVEVGAFDVEGAMPKGETGSGATQLKLDGEVAVAAVIGTPAEGEIVYGTAGQHGSYGQLVIGHAHEGAITGDAPERIIDAGTASDADGRAALIWTDTNKVPHGRLLRPKADEPGVVLPEAPMGMACLTGDRAWTFTQGLKLLSFGGGKPPATFDPIERLIGCTPDAALLRDHGSPPQLQLCSDACRTVAMPAGAPDLATVTVVGGKLVAMVAHGGVLAVWREGAKPVFFSVPWEVRPVLAHEWPAMALTDGKVIDILARGEKSFVIVRIPAAT